MCKWLTVNRILIKVCKLFLCQRADFDKRKNYYKMIMTREKWKVLLSSCINLNWQSLRNNKIDSPLYYNRLTQLMSLTAKTGGDL